MAGMRAEVKRLRGELAERISRQPDWRGGSHGVSQEIASLIAMVAAQRARESVSNVEHYMSSAGEHSAHSGASLSEKEFLQLEMLQLENDELRCALMRAASPTLYRTDPRCTQHVLRSLIRALSHRDRSDPRVLHALKQAHACRKRAEGLLRRQQYLEELMRENGLAASGVADGAAAQQGGEDAAPADDKPYYMSAPSWY